MSEQLLTYPEACQKLHVSRTHLWQMVKEGQLPEPIRLGRARRFRAADIDALIRRLAGAPQPEGTS